MLLFSGVGENDDGTRCSNKDKYLGWICSRYSLLVQSLLQATIAASRQASSPNTSTPQQTTTTQASVSNCSLTRISKPPSHPPPCSFSSLSFKKAVSQGNTASKNAGNPQDADNFEDLGCYHDWGGLRPETREGF